MRGLFFERVDHAVRSISQKLRSLGAAKKVPLTAAGAEKHARIVAAVAAARKELEASGRFDEEQRRREEIQKRYEAA